MHIDGFVRGKGKFMITEYVPTDEKTGPRFPLLLTTGRILSQYNVGAQTRRTANVVWHEEDVLEIHPHDAEQRGMRDGDWVTLAAAPARRRCARRSPSAWRRAWSTPPSTTRHAGERGHHRVTPTGPPTAPSTRSPRQRSRAGDRQPHQGSSGTRACGKRSSPIWTPAERASIRRCARR